MGRQVTIEQINKLFWEMILPFYQIERDMPLPIPSYRPENDAEHSWSLALMACCLAPHLDPKLDIGKVCQFAIVHDLVEVYAGDVSVWGEVDALASKSAEEAKALKKIKQEFTAFPWLYKTLEAYERKDTQEALFVYSLDKFIATLIRLTDDGKYFKTKRITKEQFQAKITEHREKAYKHPSIGPHYDQLLQIFSEHPEYFYEPKN